MNDRIKINCVRACWCLLALFAARTANAADTLRLRAFDRQTVVTDPSRGAHPYRTWVRFPSAREPLRKILLRVTLGCPDSLRCADWDYKDHITIRRTGGVGGASQDYELGRLLTPYGGAFGKGWQFSWEVDVTDFSGLLRDSVELEYNHTGWEPNTDRGWSVTLDFEVIRGTPVWQPLRIEKIYEGTFRYGDRTRSIEQDLAPVSFKAAPGASFARLRVVQTGHGMDQPDGCAEFCDKYRELWYDGRLVDTRAIWKPCGGNPLYPQAGTWLYNRGNWCPGMLMQPDTYDLPLQGGTHTIDLNMQPYTATVPGAEEVITAYLVHYGAPRARVDAGLEAIITPSLNDAYRRENPASFQPRIRVKNNGSEMLRRLVIRYGLRGGAHSRYRWSGTLAPGATTELALPGRIAGAGGLNVFEAEVLLPNGKKDAYVADNKAVSYFKSAPVLDSILVVYLRTNRDPGDNGYTLVNDRGQVVRQRPPGTLSAQTLYRDTLNLAAGAYRFTLVDTAGNGLEFWAHARGGRGQLRLLNGQGEMIKDFESDFGSSVQFDFSVGGPPAPVAPGASFGLYPTRTSDTTTFDFFANAPQDVTVRLLTDPGGAVVEEHRYTQLKEGRFTYDLSRYPRGRFYLSVWIGGQEQFKKRIRLKE